MIPHHRITRIPSIALLRLCLVAILGWYFFCLFSPAGKGSTVRVISLPPGSGIMKLAGDLKRQGLIRSSWHFILVSRLRGQAHHLKAGEYRINDAMTTTAILNKIVNGEVDYRRFTLPEGYSIYQAAELLQQQHLMGRDTFLKACADSSLLARLAPGIKTVEGYLYPATYNLSLGETAQRLLAQMVVNFEKKYAGLAEREKPGQRVLTRHEVITLASMIEKEAKVASEKPLIASVFHNRLRLRMPLQSDPTAVYGARAFAGVVTKTDIRRPSPYNTYLHSGLPPGPIGNPGADAIKAALYPARTPYLYFVARQDGTHHFSRTLGEHNRAVQTYLK